MSAPALILDLNSLRDACQRVSPALGSRLPIQQGIRLSVEESVMTIEAQNDDLRFVAYVPLPDVAEPMVAVVPGRLLIRFVEHLTGSTVSLEVDASREWLALSTAEADLTVSLFPLEGWALWTRGIAVAHVLDASDVEALRRVLYASSRDPDRGVLTGVHLNGRYVTASDNSRLARAALSTSLPEAVVPAEFFRHALRSGPGDTSLTIEVSADGVRLADAAGEWSTRTIMAPYPDVSPLLDRTVIDVVRLDRLQLVRALERLSVLEGSEVLTMAANDATSGTLTRGVTATGRIVEHLDCGGWTGKVSLTLGHLRDAARAGKAELMELELTGDRRPLLMREPGFTQALMTLRDT